MAEPMLRAFIEDWSPPGPRDKAPGHFVGEDEWPTPRIENFRYMLRSGMMGWLTIMIDTNNWSPEQHAEAKKEIELYKKELRPLIRDANLYHVSARPDGVHWDGMEYWDPQKQRGVLYAFRGMIEAKKTHSFPLSGLRSEGHYRLKFYDHSSPDRTVSGRELMGSGVRVTLPLSNSSELIFVEKESQ